MSLSHESAFAAGAVYSELTVLVRRQKVRLACSMVIFTVAEVVGLLLSMDKLRSEKRQEQEQETAVTPTEEVHDIESGVIEVVLFVIPFMLATNLSVIFAIARDNVWLLLPWMVLHCVVIAFLALGAAILTAHARWALGMSSLVAALIFLLCWKAIRQLFMKMVDRQLKYEETSQEADEPGAGAGARTGANGADLGGAAACDDDSTSTDQRQRHELIFFGSKDRKFGVTSKKNKDVTGKKTRRGF